MKFNIFDFTFVLFCAINGHYFTQSLTYSQWLQWSRHVICQLQIRWDRHVRHHSFSHSLCPRPHRSHHHLHYPPPPQVRHWQVGGQSAKNSPYIVHLLSWHCLNLNNSILGRSSTFSLDLPPRWWTKPWQSVLPHQVRASFYFLPKKLSITVYIPLQAFVALSPSSPAFGWWCLARFYIDYYHDVFQS